MTIIRRSSSIIVIVHTPTTENGKAELARRVADVHAMTVARQINDLNCPVKQKFDLANAVIHTVRDRNH